MAHYISDLRENSVIHPWNQASASLDGVLKINKLSSEDKDVGYALAKLTKGIASLLSEDDRWVNTQIIEVSSGMFL